MENRPRLVVGSEREREKGLQSVNELDTNGTRLMSAPVCQSHR